MGDGAANTMHLGRAVRDTCSTFHPMVELVTPSLSCALRDLDPDVRTYIRAARGHGWFGKRRARQSPCTYVRVGIVLPRCSVYMLSTSAFTSPSKSEGVRMGGLAKQLILVPKILVDTIDRPSRFDHRRLPSHPLRRVSDRYRTV